MNVKVRLPIRLLDEVRADLSRPHAFVTERVGFLYGHLTCAGADSALVFMTGYQSVADDRYIDDPSSRTSTVRQSAAPCRRCLIAVRVGFTFTCTTGLATQE